MKIQKKQLLVVFLLLIALSVFVLRPSIYPLTVYEFKKSKKQKRKERKMRDEILKKARKIKALEGEPDKAHLKIDKVSDTTAAIGLLQSQVDNVEQLLTTRTNTTIENELAPLVTRIEELESDFDSYIDESGNIIVNTIHDPDLRNKIKTVMDSELSVLKQKIDSNKNNINSNMTQLVNNVDNNKNVINDMSNTIVEIIPYTKFRDHLRNTYRHQYYKHLQHHTENDDKNLT